MRRDRAFAASATDGTRTRAWVFGGMRSDGSGVPMNEMWEFEAAVVEGGLGDGEWGAWRGEGGPPAMWEGTAVMMSDASGRPAIYLVGGAQSVDGVESLASLEEVWVFTPSAALGAGTWSTVTFSNAPVGRRDHVAVGIEGGRIWIQGGRSLDGTEVWSDSALLDVSSGSWTATSEGEQVWGHSAVVLGETVLMAFGESSLGLRKMTR